MLVSVNCSSCGVKCQAKINNISELDSNWQCPKCFDSNKHTSYKTAEQQALENLKKFCIA